MRKEKKAYDSFPELPSTLSDSEVLYWLRTRKVDIAFLKRLKECSGATDDIIAGWLNISVRTLRNYRNPENRIRENIKEKALRLPSIVIPEESNFMIQTEHPAFRTHVSILRRENFFWDSRLFGK